MGDEKHHCRKIFDLWSRSSTVSEELEETKKYVVAKQLLCCGTSVGANIFEAQHAKSKSGFVHKMKIAVKEANETLYWLLICDRSERYPVSSSLKEMAEELIRIISKIIISSKGSLKGGFTLG
ncbi:four helix bundle protein [Niabella sp. CC-SYL272]|uniref:four helix bundle protein n=1 Tax=Niabella agricola TaxID=2891571 RepID=UPI001F168BBD|nr:four helix bundle protein [Niabella agricola]MCF3109801.1 four helix bundle protein [Niabella agricola]